jgi:predicted ester cyclase
MTMRAREAFERGTDAFNAHNMDGFAQVVDDDVVGAAPGNRFAGKPAFVEFYGGWLQAFPDAHIEVHDVHFTDDIAVEEGTFSGTHDGVLHTRSGDLPPTGRAVSVD